MRCLKAIWLQVISYYKEECWEEVRKKHSSLFIRRITDKARVFFLEKSFQPSMLANGKSKNHANIRVRYHYKVLHYHYPNIIDQAKRLGRDKHCSLIRNLSKQSFQLSLMFVIRCSALKVIWLQVITYYKEECSEDW